MSSVWFTADPHFGHDRVATYRGFDNPSNHDDEIVRNWKKHVADDDQVWVLGDLALSRWRYALEVVSELPGRKHFIAGNHDPCHPMHRNAHKFQRAYLEVFESVQAFARRRLCGEHVLLSHFPYDTDHTQESRYMQYRLRDEGLWLIHGHTHSGVKARRREVHVGLDAWDLAPVNLRAIENIICEGQANEARRAQQ